MPKLYRNTQDSDFASATSELMSGKSQQESRETETVENKQESYESAIFDKMALTILQAVAEKYKTLFWDYDKIYKTYQDIAENQQRRTLNKLNRNNYIASIANDLSMINDQIEQLEKVERILKLMLNTIYESDHSEKRNQVEIQIAVNLLAGIKRLLADFSQTKKQIDDFIKTTADQKTKVEIELIGMEVKLNKFIFLYQEIHNEEFQQAYDNIDLIAAMRKISEELRELNKEVLELDNNELSEKCANLIGRFSNLKSHTEDRKSAINDEMEDKKQKISVIEKALRSQHKRWVKLSGYIALALEGFQPDISQLNGYDLKSGSEADQIRGKLQQIVTDTEKYLDSFDDGAFTLPESNSEVQVRIEENQQKLIELSNNLENNRDEFNRLLKKFKEVHKKIRSQETMTAQETMTKEGNQVDTGKEAKETNAENTGNPENPENPENAENDKNAQNKTTSEQSKNEHDNNQKNQDKFSEPAANQQTTTAVEDDIDNLDSSSAATYVRALSEQVATMEQLNKKFSVLLENINATMANLNPKNNQHAHIIGELQNMIKQKQAAVDGIKLQEFDLPKNTRDAEIAASILNANRKELLKVREIIDELDIESEHFLEFKNRSNSDKKEVTNQVSGSLAEELGKELETQSKTSKPQLTEKKLEIVEPAQPKLNDRTKPAAVNQPTYVEKPKPLNKLQVIKDVDVILKELHEQRQKKGIKKIFTKVKNFVLLLLSPRLTRKKQAAFKELETMLRDAAKQDKRNRKIVMDVVYQQWLPLHYETLKKKRGFFHFFSRNKDSSSLQDVREFKNRNPGEADIVSTDDKKTTGNIGGPQKNKKFRNHS